MLLFQQIVLDGVFEQRSNPAHMPHERAEPAEGEWRLSGSRVTKADQAASGGAPRPAMPRRDVAEDGLEVTRPILQGLVRGQERKVLLEQVEQALFGGLLPSGAVVVEEVNGSLASATGEAFPDVLALAQNGRYADKHIPRFSVQVDTVHDCARSGANAVERKTIVETHRDRRD